jgi:hypothetical protein
MEGRAPLSPDEFLLRRITACKYDENSIFPIPPDHLNPQRNDVDGISMWQESHKTAGELANEVKNNYGYLIARFTVRELVENGFALEQTGGEGHVSLPQLSYPESKKNPQSVDILKAKLAKLASQRIVYRSFPTE